MRVSRVVSGSVSGLLVAGLLTAGTASAQWHAGPYGETAILPMENAPYPHASRAKGHRYGETVFPADRHYSDNSVAIFIPEGFRAEERIELLFYFHGWGNSIEKSLERFELRRQVAKSGRNLILVFPQGPKNAKDSGCGRLEEAGALRALTDEVLARLHAEGRVPHTRLGRVGLSGHSGAYRALALSLKHGGLEEHIREVYPLDASYSLSEEFTAWIERRPESRFRSIFTEHLRDRNEAMMDDLASRGIEFRLEVDDKIDAEVLATQPVVFIATHDRSHGETVMVLEDWLVGSRFAPTSRP